MLTESLIRLYPRAWRERYGEEFLAIVGPGPLSLQQVIDIVSGAIDAWLSADVRQAVAASDTSPNEGGRIMHKSVIVCERKQVRYTKRDSLIGAGVMLVTTLILTIAGLAARRYGWSTTGEVVISLAFTVSLTLSMPFWLLKGQPWKAQAVVVVGTITLLVAAGILSTRL